jgi:hypothetical protein
MLFVEVVGKVINPPLQMGPTCTNIGVIIGLTSTLICAVVAHCPAVGVNVYVVVVVLLIAGNHVPVIPLVDVMGNVKEPPTHIDATCVKAGTVGLLFTSTVIVMVVAH